MTQKVMRKAVFHAYTQQSYIFHSEFFRRQTARTRRRRKKKKEKIFGPPKKGAAGSIADPDTVQGSPAQLVCLTYDIQRQISHCQIKQRCQPQPHFNFTPL